MLIFTRDHINQSPRLVGHHINDALSPIRHAEILRRIRLRVVDHHVTARIFRGVAVAAITLFAPNVNPPGRPHKVARVNLGLRGVAGRGQAAQPVRIDDNPLRLARRVKLDQIRIQSVLGRANVNPAV